MSFMRLRAVAIGTALAAVLVLLALTHDGVDANSRTKDFLGSGSGTSVIVNMEECDSTGRCRIELEGEFEAGEMGAGTVKFIVHDDWSRVTGRHGSCSTPAKGQSSFTWETPEGDGLVMTQTLGFACPSEDGGFWHWKRALRIVEGTGKFDGVMGTVFMSGSRTVETGEETWTFDGNLTFPVERAQRDGCYRAYFIGDLIVIPPREQPPPVAPSLSFWLCGDGVTLQGPNPREGYEIFNPRE
ncbi:MAG: hypothetical protein F4X34_04080 [Chloroflexi bacterium]|nr:hypothetical protein [Chloroflexota bacterium]